MQRKLPRPPRGRAAHDRPVEERPSRARDEDDRWAGEDAAWAADEDLAGDDRRAFLRFFLGVGLAALVGIAFWLLVVLLVLELA